ncbi:hypothetical protein [Aquimarina agarivorans]|uniref:hypothetical protein n=1 Tax=Aquimarina agarivorans TaxID=980584 RepID=UPI000248F01D|nr:hypothetical protein [Aquimarina agarivorans]
MWGIKKVIIGIFLVWSSVTFSQLIAVDVHLDTKHQIDGISTFDRKKFINIHATLSDQGWQGEDGKLEYILNDLDVYLGRDNGSMGWFMNQSKESEEQPGFVEPTHIVNQGAFYREQRYGVQMADKHKYDYRLDLVVGGQEHPFWIGETTKPFKGNPGWDIGGAKASGDFMGRYLKNFYRNTNEPIIKGMPRPKYIEIMNEPLYELVTTGDHQPIEIFKFHNAAAEGIRANFNDVMIGGYTTAFPVFEENNFQRWHNRMKLFYDTSGEHMDFISVHLYDFNKHHYNNGKAFHGPINHKGSRVEATLDMMEHYSYLKFGKVKPFMISEYGGRDHSLEWRSWSAERDWQFVKSISPLMLSFMQRPQTILKSIPFIVTKAEWGRKKVPYSWRLLRQAKEDGSRKGKKGEKWVFTELVKFYELWSDVNGTRVKTETSNLDILVDTYVEENSAYIILSNLKMQDQNIDLNLLGMSNNIIKSITAKHLYGDEDGPILEHNKFNPKKDKAFVLGAEATAILKYTFVKPIKTTKTITETKYHATTYLQEIEKGKAIHFNFENVPNATESKAVLRFGIGRDHGKSLHPTVTINGVALKVPNNYRGDDQSLRDRFFGLLEVDVPKGILKQKNTVSVIFPDAGGHVSSAILQVFSQ